MGCTLWGVIDLAIDVHHDKFQFVTLGFDVRVGDSVEFHIKRPAPLDVIHPLRDQGTLLKWRVVFFKRYDKGVFSKAIEARGEEEPAQPSFGLFALGPGPEGPPDPILRTPNPPNGSLAPFSTRLVPAGYKATPVGGIITRVGDTD